MEYGAIPSGRTINKLNNTTMMNRRLILIFNDGGKTNHLNGVSIDKDALIEHFTSAEDIRYSASNI